MKILQIFLIVFLSCSVGLAQEYNFIKYNVQEGLPQSQVYDIFQDSKSYIWIATQGGGASRFDGSTFETITTRDGLSSNYVNTVFEDRNNHIWIGTKNGLCSFDHNKVDWSERNTQNIECITAISDSILWLGTRSGIYTFNTRTKKSDKYKIDPFLDIARINQFKWINDELWIASSKGLYIKKDAALEKIEINKQRGDNDIKSIAYDGRNSVWISQFGKGVISVDPKLKTKFKSILSDDLTRVQFAMFDVGAVWFCTQNKGLIKHTLQDSSFISINENKGLSHNNVQVVFKDSWGNIWIGTSGGGIVKYLGQYFSHFNKSNGLSGNRIYAIKQSSSGALFISVSDEGITKIDSAGILSDIDSSYINSKCNHIFEDDQGRMWYSTNGEGLVMQDSTGFDPITHKDGLPSDWIQCVVQDSSGNILIGTYANGVAKLVDRDSIGVKLVLYDKSSGLPDLFITAMQMGPNGKIWIGTKLGGLAFFDGYKMHNVGQESGLPASSIRSIAFDGLNQIWIGTAGDGIYKSSSTDGKLKFVNIKNEARLSSDNIYLLKFDGASNLWAGSELGLDKITFNKSAVILDVQHFGKNEGFLGIETCHNAAEIDADGNIWFGTLNGLSKHRPGVTKLSRSSANIHFSGINVMYAPIESSQYADQLAISDSLKSNTVFKYNSNDIGFDFKAINVDDPNDIYYSWKLEGLDNNWSPQSKSESVNYTNLSAGNYRFRVKALGKNGVESDPISTSFEVAPAFWQQSWFKILMVLLFGLLLFSYYKFRISKIKKKEAEKRAKLEIKNELLGLEQKALQLQMNPHFIFNALNSIQSLVVNEKPEIARTQIQNFAGLMRGILSNSKNEKISLKEECDTLDKYLKMEQFCQTVAFDYEIKLPQAYDADEIEIPPMMVQPFVENAVIHGISHLNTKGKISIEFKIDRDILIGIIKDNGVGREKSQKINQSTKQGHQSIAMDVTKQRLQSLGGNLIKESFKIIDLKSKDGAPVGTEVQLRLPLKLNY